MKTVTLTDIYNFSINFFPGVFHSWKLFKEKALELRINLIHSSNFSWFSLPLHDVSFSLVSQISHFKIDSPTIYEDISFSQSPSERNLASMLSFFGSEGKTFFIARTLLFGFEDKKLIHAFSSNYARANFSEHHLPLKLLSLGTLSTQTE